MNKPPGRRPHQSGGGAVAHDPRVASTRRGGGAAKAPSSSVPEGQLEEARYSIRLASRMSGISSHTLRMWERRYGYPVPERTEGGARRYTETDVATLRLLARALEAGYRAGDVVGQPATNLKALILEQVPTMPTIAPPPSLEAMTTAIRRDEVKTLRDHLRQAVAALGARRFLVEVAHPLAHAIGELWVDGEISIRQEHLATDLMATQVRTLMTSDELEAGPPRIVLTTFPGEQHGLSLDMVSLYLATQNATPLSLGVSTPVREIAAAAMALNADLVGLSVSAAANIEHARRDTRLLLEELPRRVELWIGGSGATLIDCQALGARRASSWEAIDSELKRWRGAHA